MNDIFIIVAAVSAAISSFISALALYQSMRIHKQQTLLSQRQLLLPLWNHLKELNDIDSDEPVWGDVTRAVNSLELVAVCWEGDIIDRDIIRRMYGLLYIDLYDKIQDCKNPPRNIPKDGRQMLLDCPAAGKLYQELVNEHVNRGKLSPI